MIYRFLLIITNFQQQCHLFCKFDKYPGCENKIFQRNNCLVCQFYLNFSIEDDLEPVKFYPLKRKELYEKIQKELDEVRKVFY